MKEPSSNKNLNEMSRGARAAKPQTPKNVMGRGHNSFTPGKAPMGYTAVWDFSDRPYDLKNSPTSKPEKGTI